MADLTWLLLTAFGMFCSEDPEAGLKLVLTGSPGPRMQELSEAVRRMRLEDRVIFPGHLPDGEFSALLSSCMAVVYPSLYEGFGMPVLEAMASGKPVLCSNTTSLPEVAGDAALLFDPRRPREIVDAIKRIANDRLLVMALAGKGRRRAGVFGSPRAMATAYMRVFREAVSNRRQLAARIHGVWEDGWAGERVTITFEPTAQPRHIELELYAPEWIPIERLVFHFAPGSNRQHDTETLERGRRLLVKRTLYRGADRFEMVCDTLFQPSACGLGDDSRLLGCQFVSESFQGGLCHSPAMSFRNWFRGSVVAPP